MKKLRLLLYIRWPIVTLYIRCLVFAFRMLASGCLGTVLDGIIASSFHLTCWLSMSLQYALLASRCRACLAPFWKSASTHANSFASYGSMARLSRFQRRSRGALIRPFGTLHIGRCLDWHAMCWSSAAFRDFQDAAVCERLAGGDHRCEGARQELARQELAASVAIHLCSRARSMSSFSLLG